MAMPCMDAPAAANYGKYVFLSSVCSILKISIDIMHTMDTKFVEKRRQKYIQISTEGMTAKLVENMANSDLIDMHYFFHDEYGLYGDKFEEVFISSKSIHLAFIFTFSELV